MLLVESSSRKASIYIAFIIKRTIPTRFRLFRISNTIPDFKILSFQLERETEGVENRSLN